MSNIDLRKYIDTAIKIHKVKKTEEQNRLKEERSKWLSELDEKCQPYIDKLCEDIKLGSVSGKVRYSITDLPKYDAYVTGSFDSGTQKAVVLRNSVTEKVMEIVRSMGFKLCVYNWTPHSSRGDWGYNTKEYKVYIDIYLAF